MGEHEVVIGLEARLLEVALKVGRLPVGHRDRTARGMESCLIRVGGTGAVEQRGGEQDFCIGSRRKPAKLPGRSWPLFDSGPPLWCVRSGAVGQPGKTLPNEKRGDGHGYGD